MKTTPKPRATKNSSGELGPEPPLLWVLVGVGVALADIVANVVDEAILGEVCRAQRQGVDDRVDG